MDNSTLAEAYSLYYKPLFSYALFLTHNHAEAEDLVSEAFVKAILSWNGKENLRAWLFRVLKNRFIDETRRKKKIAETPQEYLLNLPDPGLKDREEAKRLNEKCEELLCASCAAADRIYESVRNSFVRKD